MKTLNTITLSGADSSKIQIIETKLLELLSALKLPITINLTQESKELKLIYKESIFYFDQENLKQDFKNLLDFLIKINPKTGRVCKCSDCKNCPSKRLNEKIITLIDSK